MWTVLWYCKNEITTEVVYMYKVQTVFRLKLVFRGELFPQI